jgi:hypothetical protein
LALWAANGTLISGMPVKVGIATLYSAVQGKKVPKDVDTGTGIVAR